MIRDVGVSDRGNEGQICLIADFHVDEARRAERESELNRTVMFRISRPGPKISVDAASIVGTPRERVRVSTSPLVVAWRMNWRAGHPHGALPIIQVRKGEQNRADVLGLVAKTLPSWVALDL